jgi:hypothetical protein
VRSYPKMRGPIMGTPKESHKSPGFAGTFVLQQKQERTDLPDFFNILHIDPARRAVCRKDRGINLHAIDQMHEPGGILVIGNCDIQGFGI